MYVLLMSLIVANPISNLREEHRHTITQEFSSQATCNAGAKKIIANWNGLGYRANENNYVCVKK